ncbi:MAG: hypothetical protein K0R67_2891 [Paenibacillus sp.]|nr:hypothetical protein [Paenibacillus sp.]
MILLMMAGKFCGSHTMILRIVPGAVSSSCSNSWGVGREQVKVMGAGFNN